jgi:serine/threonine protein kinase
MQANLSHYRILEQIGAGGMGVVYRAHDEHLDCDVALKVLPPGELADDAARRRFRKEALALSKLNHPNIAVVHDFDAQEGTDFLVEELIPGVSLSQMLASGPLSEREIINLGSQLADGLAAAHEQGVIHRDLKPANIRVTPDARLKILDFGLARITHASSPTAVTASQTQAPSFGGTLPYMAPEQLLEGKADARTDIWAAGCVLYEMATGRPPFLGTGPALIDAILHQAPPAASTLNPRLSRGLQAIILQCLEKDPSLRYASARDIAVDLHRLTSSSSAILVAPKRRCARARNLVIASAVVVLVVIAVAVVSRLTLRQPGGKVPQSEQVTASIAVLPFADMSPGKDQEYFSDGLAEELLNALAKIPELRVTARTSSFQFKGKNEDLRVIGEKLNVATILEGSVRKQGNRVRITAQLIKVADGFYLWSESYDRNLNDIFAVQEDIARSVAGSLKLQLVGRAAVVLK